MQCTPKALHPKAQGKRSAALGDAIGKQVSYPEGVSSKGALVDETTSGYETTLMGAFSQGGAALALGFGMQRLRRTRQTATLHPTAKWSNAARRLCTFTSPLSARPRPATAPIVRTCWGVLRS